MDLPIDRLQIIGTFASGLLLAVLAQWGKSRDRSSKTESGLRAELMGRVKEQDKKIEVLTARENDCNRHLVWLQQWLWTLHAALKGAGVEVDLPHELTLEGYEQPFIKAGNFVPAKPAPYVPGVKPATPDFTKPDPIEGDPRP